MKSVDWGNIVVVYRWDGWEGWLKEIWEDVELNWFTSVANNTDDIILQWGNNIRITIEWQEGRVKDVSSLALFVNFADKINKPFTKNEWVILSNSIMRIVDVQKNTYKWVEIIDIRVKQTQ